MATVSPGRSVPAQPAMGCGYAVIVLLLAGGVGLLVLASKSFQQGGPQARLPGTLMFLLGLGLLFGAWAYLGLARRLVRESREEAARRAEFPQQPWKWPKAWQGPAIASDNAKTAAGLWVFAILWNLIAFPAVWAVFSQPQAQKAAYLVILFPLVGLGVLWAALYQTIGWRKYGRSRFVPSGLPGVIGGYLGGVIEVPAQVVPEGEAKLALKCIRRETRGSGKNRSTNENVLWEREESIARDKWVTGLGGARIPVLFYIPPECRGTDDSDRNNEIRWHLSAGAATVGVDFATQFTVPVFATGETAAPPEAGAPVLEEYSVQALDATALQACGVRREGDTFHFSTSHLPGTKATTAGLLLGILALLAWFTGQDVPGAAWAITVFFGLIIGLFASGVWFSRYELNIEAKDVVVTKPRPWGTKVTRMPRAEVAQVRAEKSMSAGERQYFRLSLVGAAGVDPSIPATPGEPFAARKLRYQLEQAKQQGELTPGKALELGGELMARLRAQAKFVVPFAEHIPGQGRAEALGAQILALIHKR